MDAVPTVINALVVAFATTILWFITRAQTEDIARRLERHEDKADARFERLEAKIERVDAKVDVVRTDITQLAFRLGDHPQPQTG